MGEGAPARYKPHTVDPTDEALLTALQAGDDKALGVLLEKHLPAVYRFGVKMCRDPEDAKDVAQETLLAAARGLRDFRGASSVSTWLFTIARSFCIKKRRKRVGEPSEQVALDADDAGAMADSGALPDDRGRGSGGGRVPSTSPSAPSRLRTGKCSSCATSRG